MRNVTYLAVLASTVAIGLFAASGIGAQGAQEIVGTIGSPKATTSIDGKQLPPPDPRSEALSRRLPRNPSLGGLHASYRLKGHRTYF